MRSTFLGRYIGNINDCMKSEINWNDTAGILRNENLNVPELHKIGCMGKIGHKRHDGRYLIELKGLIRFNIISEIRSEKIS